MLKRFFNGLPLIFCFSCFLSSSAQKTPYFIEKLTTRDGLSSNTITDMVQDDNGFLWVATSDGLNRFDGTEVTQYFYQSSANSIPHNYVYCLKKLPGNCLAIGTQGGLSIYNGKNGTFRNFYFGKSEKFEEYNNIIVELELDTKGNLWAASRNCIYVLDGQLSLKKVFRSPFTESDAATRRLQYSDKIIPLADGHVLISLFDGWSIGSADSNEVIPLEQSGLKNQLDFILEVSTRVRGEKFEQYFPYSHVFKVFDRYFLCMKSDQDSLFLMDESGHRRSACYFAFNKYPNVLWSQKAIEVDSTHLLFLFHDFGLAIVPISWKNSQPTMSPVSTLFFETSEFNDALSDRQGNWWLATVDNGLQKISPVKQAFINVELTNPTSAKQTQWETSAINRYGNSLWVSTYGDGFYQMDLRSGRRWQYHFHRTGNDLWANCIWNLRLAGLDTLWVGTQTGLFWFKISSQKNGRIGPLPGKPSVLDSVPITTQFEDSHGLVWMGLGRGKGVCFYDTKKNRFSYFPNNAQGYPLRYPLAAAEDAKSDLWFTNDASNLLVLWKRSTNRFQTVVLPATAKSPIGNLYEIFCENDSIYWLGSVTNGLIKFNVLNNTISVFGHDRDLINSHIKSIWQDQTKRLWLATDGGLSCFNPRTETFFNYSQNDGLPVRTPTASLFYDSLAGRVYTGGLGSYFYFDPYQMSASLSAQNTIITSVQVNGQPYVWEADAPIIFSPQQNDITIHYTAVDLTSGPQTVYAYKLVGEDTGWILAGHQRQINFSHLAPGHYQFMVRSQNNQGIPNPKHATIRFEIRPPFSQTIWYYGLIVLAIASLFYSFYRFRIHQLTRTEALRNEISKNLHDEVGSTLTNISLTSLLAQKQLQQNSSASRLMERIYQDSQMVSQTMREIVWSINPKIDTLGDALPRMLQYASEMLEGKNIQLKAEISTQIEQIKLTMEERRDLYLIFKESVNNLARHSNALNAQIHFQLDEGLLKMSISDDGKGFDNSVEASGNGLKNIKERAIRHKWQLVIHSKIDSGTVLELRADVA
jgi:ligand-binding sensor domain-containing protein/two-component sensor histidine kinase